MMLSATLATYSFDVYGSSASEAGLVVGAFIMGALVSRIFAGRYTETIGRRKLLVAGCFAMSLTSLLYFIPMGVEAFIFVRVVHGMAFGVTTNTMLVVGAAYIPEERWGEGMGFFSLSASLSCALGPFVGLELLKISANAMFAFSTLSCVLALATSMALRIEEHVPGEGEDADAASRKGFRWRDYFEPKAIPLSALLMVWGICYSGMGSFVNTFGGMLGLAAFVPAFFAVHSAANIISRMPVGRLYDRMGENVVIVPSVICFVVSLVVLAFCSNPAMMVVSGVLSGLGYGSLFFIAQALALQAAPPHRVGVATSTFFVFADTGAGIGPLIMGLLHPFVGYSGMYLVAAAVSVLSLPVYYMMHGRRIAR